MQSGNLCEDLFSILSSNDPETASKAQKVYDSYPNLRSLGNEAFLGLAEQMNQLTDDEIVIWSKVVRALINLLDSMIEQPVELGADTHYVAERLALLVHFLAYPKEHSVMNFGEDAFRIIREVNDSLLQHYKRPPSTILRDMWIVLKGVTVFILSIANYLFNGITKVISFPWVALVNAFRYIAKSNLHIVFRVLINIPIVLVLVILAVVALPFILVRKLLTFLINYCSSFKNERQSINETIEIAILLAQEELAKEKKKQQQQIESDHQYAQQLHERLNNPSLLNRLFRVTE